MPTKRTLMRKARGLEIDLDSALEDALRVGDDQAEAVLYQALDHARAARRNLEMVKHVPTMEDK